MLFSNLWSLHIKTFHMWSTGVYVHNLVISCIGVDTYVYWWEINILSTGWTSMLLLVPFCTQANSGTSGPDLLMDLCLLIHVVSFSLKVVVAVTNVTEGWCDDVITYPSTFHCAWVRVTSKWSTQDKVLVQVESHVSRECECVSMWVFSLVLGLSTF